MLTSPSESVTRDANGNLIHKSVLNYDGKNRVKEFLDILPDSSHKTAYTYDADSRVTEVKFDDSDTHKVNLTYDLLNRVTNRTVTNGVPYSTNYIYVEGNTASYGANATTPLISTITQGSGANAMNFAYTYDSRGNITSETRNGVTTTYEYDELGQLIRVNDPNDPSADSVHGTTWIITYDRGGNILQKLAYVLTSDAQPSELRQSLIYEYTDANWKDKLTVFCNDEREYDAIGNLTDDGQWTYTWEKGRQLKSMHNPYTGVTMEFKYNHEGIRTQKVKKVNGTVTETTDYILKGKTVAAMKKNTDTYYFNYDASGKPATVNFNGEEYTYVKNFQGDIVGILDASGTLVVEYKYDAWGDPVYIYSASLTSDPLAFDNPFRYRGYVWDGETGLYYLRSRYYSARFMRFYIPDIGIKPSGDVRNTHLYAYCKNNPVYFRDANGKTPNLATLDASALSMIAGVIGSVIGSTPTSESAIEHLNSLMGEGFISGNEGRFSGSITHGEVSSSEEALRDRCITIADAFISHYIANNVFDLIGALAMISTILGYTAAIGSVLIETPLERMYSLYRGTYTAYTYTWHMSVSFFGIDIPTGSTTYTVYEYDDGYIEVWMSSNDYIFQENTRAPAKIMSREMN